MAVDGRVEMYLGCCRRLTGRLVSPKAPPPPLPSACFMPRLLVDGCLGPVPPIQARGRADTGRPLAPTLPPLPPPATELPPPLLPPPLPPHRSKQHNAHIALSHFYLSTTKQSLTINLMH